MELLGHNNPPLPWGSGIEFILPNCLRALCVGSGILSIVIVDVFSFSLKTCVKLRLEGFPCVCQVGVPEPSHKKG